MPPLDLSGLLNPSHWFDGNPGSPSPYYLILVVVFALLTVAGGVSYYYLRPGRFRDHALRARLAEVVGVVSISLGLWGLFLLFMRYLNVGILSARVLLYLTILVVLGLAGYFVYFYLRRYPSMLATYHREEEHKRFLPKPKEKGKAMPSAAVPHAKKKGKRKR